jgi:hypothetical protein
MSSTSSSSILSTTQGEFHIPKVAAKWICSILKEDDDTSTDIYNNDDENDIHCHTNAITNKTNNNRNFNILESNLEQKNIGLNSLSGMDLYQVL